MAVDNIPSSPRPVAAPQTNQTAAADAGDNETLDASGLADFLKNDENLLSARFQLAGARNEATPEDRTKNLELVKNSSWAKTFDKNLDARIAKLGANPTKADVKKEATKELFAQQIFKFAVDRANGRIMARIKELSADTFG